jgi:hypothetical protein
MTEPGRGRRLDTPPCCRMDDRICRRSPGTGTTGSRLQARTHCHAAEGVTWRIACDRRGRSRSRVGTVHPRAAQGSRLRAVASVGSVPRAQVQLTCWRAWSCTSHPMRRRFAPAAATTPASVARSLSVLRQCPGNVTVRAAPLTASGVLSFALTRPAAGQPSRPAAWLRAPPRAPARRAG